MPAGEGLALPFGGGKALASFAALRFMLPTGTAVVERQKERGGTEVTGEISCGHLLLWDVSVEKSGSIRWSAAQR